MDRRTLLGSVAATSIASFGFGARAAPDNTIRIGVITDLSGPYRDASGQGSVACAQQAASEFTAAHPGIAVEVLSADHQNKPDIGLSIIKEWIDRGNVDVVTDIGNSAVALAAASIVEAKDKVAIVTTASSSDLTGKSCSRNLLHWSYDAWSSPHTLTTALTKAGGDKWFFVSPDYSSGHASQRDAASFVEAAGGKVLGATFYPFPGTTDFSSYLLQAGSSGANVLALGGGGDDLDNAMKQSQEFGLTNQGIRIAALVGLINNVISLGLPASQGLLMVENFYWDLNDRTRAFTARIKPRLAPGTVANQDQVGNYSGVLHYLKAVAVLGVNQAKASGRAAIEVMKRTPTDDDCFGHGSVRPDGRVIHSSYLFAVKEPQESKGPMDVFKLVATVPAEDAFRPMSEGGCPLIRL